MATALMPRQRPIWYDSPDRACADPGDVQFFAPDIEDPKQKRRFDAAPAKRMCRSCPFINECLNWALKTNQRYGIWGGQDERQRRAIRRCLNDECNSRCTHPHRRRKVLR